MTANAILKINPDRSAELVFAGEWILNAVIENRAAVLAAFEKPDFDRAVFNGRDVTNWNSELTALLVRLVKLCKKNNVAYVLKDFPAGVEPLLNLAFAVPEHAVSGEIVRGEPFVTVLGNIVLDFWKQTKGVFSFCRQIHASFKRFFFRRAVLRKQDFLIELQRAGVEAFAIVSLICFLVGLILAFVGSIQLKMFGAQIYVSSLVAISITRVMGAIMTGVIMAGRTGASYAATLGSMQVNEEVDALKTMGISPFDFLIMPRVLALTLMMPLLTVYADLMGILGGAFVGIFMLGLSPEDYFRMTLKALLMRNIIIGIIHGAVYGVIIAVCGCYQGINCGRNASAVGSATTSAVVYSIIWMTIATAVLTFFFTMGGV
ncbi:MAG: ABC transporter permease [Alphaproteobacteria bacterium]|nr:ABC transporter permease [Alphaproteobacteria bacterium]